MIKISIGQYRSISEPYVTLFGSNNVEFELVQDQDELSVVINQQKLTKTKDIITSINQNFDSLFTNKVNIINQIPAVAEDIITAYDHILDGQIDEDSLQKINSFLSGQFLQSSSLLTVYDFLLHELAQTLSHLNRPLYERFENIIEFISKFETTESIQPWIFNQTLILKPFSKHVKNVYNEIEKIASKNLNTFADFANLENCSYHFKLQLKNGEEKVYTDHIPFSVSPILIQKKEFDEFYSKTQLWNELIDKMSKNFEWAKEIFKNMSDPLLQGFLKIAEKANKSEITQKIQMGLIRNDVLHSAVKHKWLQVEYNTISISFGYIAEQVQSLQRTIKNSYLKNFFEEYTGLQGSSVSVVVEGLKNAYDLYDKPNSQILVVVSGFEGNSYDQRYPEYLLARDHGIICKRRTFEQLIEQTEVKEDGTMLVEGDEIAVIYYRTGYSPDHFPNEEIWKIREKIELTKAIKCPSVNIILVGFKKLQKTLQEAGQMEQFLNKQQCEQIKENFATIYDFEDETKHQELLNLAKNEPQHYILKPQREGGDNNIYGKNIYPFLEKLTPSERKNYILMEKIIPKPSITFMIRNRKLEVAPSISELGIISYFISDSQKIIHNKAGGYLVRTKRYFDDEGGVNAGYSVIDGLMIKKQQV
ncbi:hypothetical protein ABPG74_002321 [Tetrahymena malaccensis]